MSRLDPDILAQLLLMQTVMSKLPDENTIVEFVCQGIKDIPGVAGVESLGEQAPPESERRQAIAIKSEGRAVIWLRLELDDAALFADYEPFLRNFAVMVGMMVDKLRQQRKIEVFNRELSESLELQRKLHSELVLKEKIASLSPMSMVLAHELNTPVGNILTMGSSLGERSAALKKRLASGVPAEELAGFLDMVGQASGLITASAKTAIDLVQRFRQAISSRADSHRQIFAIENLVRDTIAMVKTTVACGRVAIDSAVEPGLELDSYPGALGQVLEHLLVNAVRHGFPDQAEGSVFVRAHRVGDRAETTLVVQDNGRGIPEENQRRVFEPFFTTSFGQGGSGLGLSIVYHVVTEILGGTVSLSSQPGLGSVFTLNIPLRAA